MLKYFFFKVERGEGNLAFSILKCALENSDELKEIWKYYSDEVKYKV